MEDRADRDLFERYSKWALLLLVVLVLTEYLLMRIAPTLQKTRTAVDLAIAIIPNIIASLITVFGLYIFNSGYGSHELCAGHAHATLIDPQIARIWPHKT